MRSIFAFLIVLIAPGFVQGQSERYVYHLDTIIYTDLKFRSDYYFFKEMCYTYQDSTLYYYQLSQPTTGETIVVHTINLATNKQDSLVHHCGKVLQSLKNLQPVLLVVKDSLLVIKYVDQLLVFRINGRELSLLRSMYLNETVRHIRILSDSTLFTSSRDMVFGTTVNDGFGQLGVYNFVSNEYDTTVFISDMSVLLTRWQRSDLITTTSAGIFYADKYRNCIRLYGFDLVLKDSFQLSKPRRWVKYAKQATPKLIAAYSITDQKAFYEFLQPTANKLYMMTSLSSLNDSTLVAVYNRLNGQKRYSELIRVRNGKLVSLGLRQDYTGTPDRIITRDNFDNTLNRRTLLMNQDKIVVFESTDPINPLGMKVSKRYAAGREYYKTNPHVSAIYMFSVRFK